MLVITTTTHLFLGIHAIDISFANDDFNEGCEPGFYYGKRIEDLNV
jgi:hypothetical protein